MADSHERDGFHRGAVTARIMALARSTQAKILVVDDDELELALVCDRLQSCGLDVRQAANGAQGLEDTYVIMLTVLDSGFDYERAYAAGVDDYLSKKMPEVELLSRIHAGFSTVSLRRQLQEAREKLAQLQAG